MLPEQVLEAVEPSVAALGPSTAEHTPQHLFLPVYTSPNVVCAPCAQVMNAPCPKVLQDMVRHFVPDRDDDHGPEQGGRLVDAIR